MNTIKGMKSAFAALCEAVATMSALAEVWPDGSQMYVRFVDPLIGTEDQE